MDNSMSHGTTLKMLETNLEDKYYIFIEITIS